MAMEDSMKAITLLIAEACVNSVIESISASTLSNVQVGSGRLSAMVTEWTVSYKPNPSGPKREAGVKPPLVLTKEFSALEPGQPGRLRKDVAAERRNKVPLWGKTWRRRWRCMLVKLGTCWGQRM